MIKRTKEEILAKCLEIWPDGDSWRIPDFEVDITPDAVRLTVSHMYEAPGLSYAILMNLADFFGTKAINDEERFSNNGCETCDYGSSYGFTLVITPEK